ncbi:MAG TPA: hypothetical protein VGB99_10050 [Acidobacteriota bacterium]
MGRKQNLLMAAVAGITFGISQPQVSAGEEEGAEVKCYGINGCGSHASCAVSQADLDAVKALLGDEGYGKQFGKSEVHGCGSHAKCGASSGILNWTSTSKQECSEAGGLLIEEVGGKKVAKQA